MTNTFFFLLKNNQQGGKHWCGNLHRSKYSHLDNCFVFVHFWSRECFSFSHELCQCVRLMQIKLFHDCPLTIKQHRPGLDLCQENKVSMGLDVRLQTVHLKTCNLKRAQTTDGPFNSTLAFSANLYFLLSFREKLKYIIPPSPLQSNAHLKRHRYFSERRGNSRVGAG